MNVRDEHTRSLWMDVRVADAPGLSRAERADVVVIGSGIAGLSVAYELASRGRSVVVLDRGSIGSGMTARTTAHLASALDDDYTELVRVRGQNCARLCYQSVAAAIDRAEAIQSTETSIAIFAGWTVTGCWLPIRLHPTSTRNWIAARSLGFPLKTARSRRHSIPKALCGRYAFRGRR